MLNANQLQELRKSLPFPSLDTLVSQLRQLCTNMPPRSLVGSNSILQRTLGDDFQGPTHYKRTYFDHHRNADAQTEFAELVEALETYDSNPTRENMAETLLELGDLLYQSQVIDEMHSRDVNYDSAKKEMERAIEYVQEQLRLRKIDPNLGKVAARIKYGTRVWCKARGLQVKNKETERQLVLEII